MLLLISGVDLSCFYWSRNQSHLMERFMIERFLWRGARYWKRQLHRRVQIKLISTIRNTKTQNLFSMKIRTGKGKNLLVYWNLKGEFLFGYQRKKSCEIFSNNCPFERFQIASYDVTLMREMMGCLLRVESLSWKYLFYNQRRLRFHEFHLDNTSCLCGSSFISNTFWIKRQPTFAN